MSNGTPEPFEDKIGKSLGVPATMAIGYTVLWTVAAVVHWIVPPAFPRLGAVARTGLISSLAGGDLQRLPKLIEENES